MSSSDGNHYHHFGTFIEIEHNRRLVFSWASEEQIEGWRDKEGNPTVVTVEFLPYNGGVEITITHENLTSDTAVNSLEYGWSGTLDRFADALI